MRQIAVETYFYFTMTVRGWAYRTRITIRNFVVFFLIDSFSFVMQTTARIRILMKKSKNYIEKKKE